MRKFKVLILLIFVISTAGHSLSIFADTPTFNESSTSNPNNQTPNENKSTVLDGEIGEWDPELNDNPDFNNPELEDIEGNIPKDNEYYTISVTVPINMEFLVFKNSQSTFGSFFSPLYTVKNNGSKNICVNVASFEAKEGIEDENTTPLYVEILNSGDNKTQIELNLCGVEDLVTCEVNKKIDLTNISSLSDDDKRLYLLSANETKGIKFDSDRWELPRIENNKEKAISNFNVGFVFSVVR